MSPVALGVVIFSARILCYWLSGSFLPKADTGLWMTPVKSTGPYSPMPWPPPLAWLGGAQVKILLGAAIDSG